MKEYFEKVYVKDNVMYCMNIQEPFIDSKGRMTKEAYYIYQSMRLSDGFLTDWELVKTYQDKSQAIKKFESLIK